MKRNTIKLLLLSGMLCGLTGCETAAVSNTADARPEFETTIQLTNSSAGDEFGIYVKTSANHDSTKLVADSLIFESVYSRMRVTFSLVYNSSKNTHANWVDYNPTLKGLYYNQHFTKSKYSEDCTTGQISESSVLDIASSYAEPYMFIHTNPHFKTREVITDISDDYVPNFEYFNVYQCASGIVSSTPLKVIV